MSDLREGAAEARILSFGRMVLWNRKNLLGLDFADGC